MSEHPVSRRGGEGDVVSRLTRKRVRFPPASRGCCVTVIGDRVCKFANTVLRVAWLGGSSAGEFPPSAGEHHSRKGQER